MGSGFRAGVPGPSYTSRTGGGPGGGRDDNASVGRRTAAAVGEPGRKRQDAVPRLRTVSPPREVCPFQNPSRSSALGEHSSLGAVSYSAQTWGRTPGPSRKEQASSSPFSTCGRIGAVHSLQSTRARKGDLRGTWCADQGTPSPCGRPAEGSRRSPRRLRGVDRQAAPRRPGLRRCRVSLRPELCTLRGRLVHWGEASYRQSQAGRQV